MYSVCTFLFNYPDKNKALQAVGINLGVVIYSEDNEYDSLKMYRDGVGVSGMMQPIFGSNLVDIEGLCWRKKI